MSIFKEYTHFLKCQVIGSVAKIIFQVFSVRESEQGDYIYNSEKLIQNEARAYTIRFTPSDVQSQGYFPVLENGLLQHAVLERCVFSKAQ